MQQIASNLSDAFTDYKGVTKSLNPAVNAPSRVEVPNKTTQPPSKPKRGRARQQEDASRKRPKTGRKKLNSTTVNVSQLLVDGHRVDTIEHPQTSSQARATDDAGRSEDPDALVLGNHDELHGVQEISINYTSSGELLDRKTTVVNSCFSTMIAGNLLTDPDPKSMVECQQRSDWNKWKEAIEAELSSLKKREVFTAVMPTPPRVHPVGFKWVFTRKRNENNEVVRYKARLVAQGFTQRPGIDFNETYSPVMNGITFRYLISLAVQKRLSLQLMDVVTAYLYGSLDSDIYMKVPNGISILNSHANRNMYCVKLTKSLYGLKQSGRMWYNRLKEFLLNKGYSNSDDCPCVFIKKSPTGFYIISVYVDDLNIIGHTKDIDEARNHLKTEFEMKDLGKTKFCLGL